MNIRFYRNIFYLFKGIREIGDSKDKFFYKCLKCKSKLESYKNYGKINLVCRCGHIAKVHTGKNIHLEKQTDNKNIELKKKPQNIHSERLQRENNFKKYLQSDFRYLYELISRKRDIAKQVTFKQCEHFIHDRDDGYDEGYEEVVKYLQKFCNLYSAPIKVTWEPVYQQKALIENESNLHIFGTTYIMPLHSNIFYTIYLNPEFTWNHKTMIGTVAHEMSHIFASYHQINFKTLNSERGKKEIQEQMTDLLGIVLGMGQLMYNDEKSNNQDFNTCYLTNDMIGESYHLWIKEYLSGRNKDIKTFVICDNCSQKLMVPLFKKNSFVICPKCKNRFKFSY